MITRQENESSNPYLNTNLSAEEHERLTKELKNDPELLRELLRHQTPEDKKSADALLFKDFDAAAQNNLDGELRSYLLRDPMLEDEKFAELEELIIEDERYLERMTLIESELIEDYLRGSILTTDEKQRFDNYFLVTPERRQKLKFIESLALSYAAEQKEIELPTAEPILVKPSNSSRLQSLFSFMPLPNLFIGTAAASVLLLFIIGTIWWLSGRAERQNELIAVAPTNESVSNLNRSSVLNLSGNLNQTADTGEVGNLSASPKTPQTTTTPMPTKLPPTNPAQKQNEIPTPTPPVNAPRSVVFALFSGVLRGGDGNAEQKIGASKELIELRLRLSLDREYENYRIVVQNFDGKEIGRREKLKASKKTVTVVLPADAFQPDDYTVILSGKTKGEYVDLARYNFRILK